MSLRPAKLKEKNCGFAGIYQIPGEKIYSWLPDQFRSWITQKLFPFCRYQFSQSKDQGLKQAQEFVIKQISFIFWGLLSVIIVGSILWIHSLNGEDQLHFRRNVLGKGRQQVILKMENEEETTEISLDVEEQQANRKEINLLYAKFFQELEEKMCGKNASLQQVSKPLHFDSEINGYPFYIQYEVKDIACIKPDGSLGKKAEALKKGDVETTITVTASYLNYEREKDYHIKVVPGETEMLSPFEKAKEKLLKIEKETRQQTDFTVPSNINGIKIAEQMKGQKAKTLIFLMVVFVVGIVVQRYENLKKTGKQCQEIAAHDFPVIVHLLTLYIGAGLSFARSVHRISQDYKEGFLTSDQKKHYAFDEIVMMDIKMQTGFSQKEACEQWAKDMDDPSYRKLSLLLIQSLSKGGGEVRFFMDQMEKEVFNRHVDRVKKRGEEASAKLLFPMVVLMGIVMIMIMFPALMQFGQF